VVIVDDDTADAMLAEEVIDELQPRFPVQILTSGEDLISYLKGQDLYSDRSRYPYPGLVLLDLKMPKMDGFEVARRMRAENNGTPLLILTAKDSVPDVVHGLDLGADDYLTKPFSFDELLLRLRAVNRRAVAPCKAQLQVGDLLLDLATREVYRDRERISLTRTEYGLLERLMRDAGEVIPREALISILGPEVGSNTLDAFVRLLRNKIDRDCSDRRKLIHTVRGVGYTIRVEYE